MSMMRSVHWTILDTGINSAKENMEIDAGLLEELATVKDPVLHFYEWKAPSATYGHFIDPSKYLSPEAFRCLDFAKRPTGGGVIIHTSDFAFSILVPASHPAHSVNTLENYAFVNNLLIEVIAEFSGCEATLGLLLHEPQAMDVHSKHFCMAKPTKYDVMLDGKKVGGGAQRRTKLGFLHQGTVSLALPEPDFLQKILLPNTCVFESMQHNTYALLGGETSHLEIVKARNVLKEIFTKICLSK